MPYNNWLIHFFYITQVACIACDGAKPNRKFMKLHKHPDDIKHGVLYRTKNIYAKDGHYLYFMSDVP